MSTSKEKDKPKEDGARKGGLISRFMKLDVKKKIQYAVILLIIIVILAIYFSSVSGGKTAQPGKDSSAVTVSAVSNDSIEDKLMQTLSAIEGAGKVQVMITYKSSAELVPAISVDKQTSKTTEEGEDGKSTTSTENTQSEVVTVGGNDGNEALVLKENSPQIRGVIVIAEGADDIGVRLNLLSAVQTILDISPDQVNVYKMNIE